MTADNQWIEVEITNPLVKKEVRMFTHKNKIFNDVTIHINLLDQLRRDAKEEQAQIDVEEYQNLLQKKKQEARQEAKKELLDDMFIHLLKAHKQNEYIFTDDEFLDFRAKTLREKKE